MDRTWFLLAAVAGCYDPTATVGVRCGDDGACPVGQTCLGEHCVLPGTVEDAAPDVPVPPPIDAPSAFFDDFMRPDADTLGNGWIEKTPATFALQGGEVVRVASMSYRDNLVYRPASEDLRDVELSVLLKPHSVPPGSPQIFVRGVSSTIATAGSYDGYLMYATGSMNEVVIGRQLGAVFVETLARYSVSPGWVVGETYRFSLRAVGATPVILRGRVERETPTGWTVVGEASVDDTAPERLVGAGTVGFSGSTGDTGYTFDDVMRTPL